MNSPTRYSAEVRVKSTLAPTVTTLNEGRSLNSGDTGSPRCAVTSATTSLNEGRSLNSGDTALALRMAPSSGARSTKAGV